MLCERKIFPALPTQVGKIDLGMVFKRRACTLSSLDRVQESFSVELAICAPNKGGLVEHDGQFYNKEEGYLW